MAVSQMSANYGGQTFTYFYFSFHFRGFTIKGVRFYDQGVRQLQSSHSAALPPGFLGWSSSLANTSERTKPTKTCTPLLLHSV